jgi:hypothetical protein
MKTLLDLMMITSDHLGAFSGKFINAVGALSIGAGAAVGAISSVATIQTDPQAWLRPEYVMAASIFGSVCFGIKHLYDFVNSIIDRRAKKQSDDKLTPKD